MNPGPIVVFLKEPFFLGHPVEEKKLISFILMRFFLFGQGSLCLNKSGQDSKSDTIRGFDPIPSLRARPKCRIGHTIIVTITKNL